MDVPNLDIAGELAARSARFSTGSLALIAFGSGAGRRV
jgi:hypothetical protein